MSDKPPDWPVGYPCIATQTWNPPKDILGYVAIQKGDECVVTRRDPTKPKLVYITVNRRKVRGWVESLRLSRPGNRKFQDIKIVSDFRPGTTLQLPVITAKGYFANAVRAHINGIASTIGVLPWLARSVRTELQVQGVNGLTNAVCEAFANCSSTTKDFSFQDVLNNPELTVMDLVRAGISIDSKNEQAGVYLRIYWDFRDQPQRKPELYVGQAGNLHKRSLRHLQDTKTNDKSNHYLAARQAKKYKAFPIALTSDLKLRTIIEQLGVMLFMSYVMVIRGYSTKIEVTRTIDPQKVVDVQTKYYRDGQSANILSRAAEEAATHIGWKAGCERPGFGSDIGLNWRSPLSTMDPINDPIIWVRTDNPGVVATFRRSPTTARDSAGARVFMNKANVTGDSNFKVKTKSSTEGLPALGTEVHVVAEVMLNGEQHPHAWARLPTVGCWSDWDLVMGIAWRVEWEDEKGNWHAHYTQAEATLGELDPDVPGSLTSYAMAKGIRHFLMQEHTVSPPAWWRDFGIATVKTVTYDHQSQEIRIQDKAPEPLPCAIPSRLKSTELRMQLVDLGAQLYATPHGVFVDGAVRTDPNRCDTCFLMPKTHPCQFVEGTRACKNCTKLGRDCSWTDRKKLLENDELQRALSMQPASTNSIVDIEDPEAVEHKQFQISD